jgi:hypothetical protein
MLRMASAVTDDNRMTNVPDTDLVYRYLTGIFGILNVRDLIHIQVGLLIHAYSLFPVRWLFPDRTVCPESLS